MGKEIKIMRGREFLHVVDLFDNEIVPQIQKLKFLAEAFDTDEGEESDLGFRNILEDIVEHLEEYKHDMNMVFVYWRKQDSQEIETPEFITITENS
jgi:hypothetical protein